MRVEGPALEQHDESWPRWVVDNCLGLLLVLDERERIADANAVAIELLGFTREQLVGMPLAEIDFERRATVAVAAATSRRTLWRSITLRRRFGGPIRITVRVDRELSPSGWRTYLLSEASGSTASPPPLEVQTRFLQLCNAIDAVYWLLDIRENRVVYVSDAYERVWGQSREQLYRDGNAWLASIHPEDRPQVAAALGNRGAPPGDFDMRYRVIRPDGRELWIRDRAFPMVDEDGVARRFAGIANDVTAEVRAEHAARSHARQLGDLLDAVKAQVWYLDPQGAVIFQNSCATELARGRDIGPHGKTVTELAGLWDDPARRQSETMQAIRSGVPRVGSIESYALDGDVRWVSVDKVPTVDDTGEVTGLLVFIYDITALKRAESQARGAAIQLEQANAELESFSYSVSHDLRAPLRSIDGFSRALLDDCGAQLDVVGHEHIERVRDATKRMGNLIDALLELSRVIRKELRREPVDVSELARQVAAELDRRHPERQVRWSIESGMTTRADLRMAALVLENVLGNAHKFTAGADAARIELFTERRNDATWFVVRDNGVGFESGFARQLFTPFGRLHSRREFPGSGIGLATVRRIVRRHGGEVEGIGAPGAGATFSFSFEPPQMSKRE